MGWSPVRASTFGAMPSPVAPSSRGADVTKGVVSLLGLVALAVAVPFLLTSYIGWPLPRGVPPFDEITAAPGDRYVPDRFPVGAPSPEHQTSELQSLLPNPFAVFCSKK